MFSACTTYEKQLRIEKTRLSHQVWSHGGSTFKKKRTLNGHFSRPAETDPYVSHSNRLPCSVLKIFYIFTSDKYIQPDLKFVKKFTRPNFRAKEFYTLKTRKLRLFSPAINSKNASLSVIWPPFG